MPDDNSPLSAIPTRVLVAELKKRTKMEEIFILDCSESESYYIDVGGYGIDEHRTYSDDGPAQILMVREDESKTL